MLDENSMIADLHIHSRFSRACSRNIDFENLVKWARIKGLDLLGTGDFTHPVWIEEIKKLRDGGKGFYYFDDFPFVISGEVSLMYTQERGRRIHLVLLVSSIEVAEKINSYLDTKGRRDYDGRPIFKIPGDEFVREMMNISTEIEIIPAHCLPGNSVIHSNHSLKKIKDICEGDMVYTHNNNWKKVVKVFSRKYNRKLYKIKPWYWTEGLESTSEHPFYAIKSYKCSWIKGLCKESCSKLDECKNKRFEKYLREWVPASELKEGDFLVYPRFNKIVNRKLISGIKLSTSFCRLLGYYLAEGYTIRDEGIGFSFNKNEGDYINEVIYLINKIFGKSKFKIDERKGKDIIFYSKKINKFFSKFYNSKIKRANTKCLLDFMLELPLNKQLEIFRCWYRGDKGYTVSRELINQMKIICLRLGIIPNIYADLSSNHKKRGNHFIKDREIKSNHDLYSLGNLSFFEDKFNLLIEDEFMKFKTKMSRRHGWIDRDYVYLPIRKIEVSDFNDYVYNLEVEDDNSYVSEFACVHNCWTPWFGVFGSNSGFDSLKECFKEQIDNVHAIETGMSSSPDMNWKIKELENKSIVSFSDAHCVHPDTFITLGDGYVLPISDIKEQRNFMCADINKFISLNKNKMQFCKVPSPLKLKKIEYFGGEIFVSDKHRFFVFENNCVIEKFAFELKKGDILFRLAKLPHKTKKVNLKSPEIDIYYFLEKEALNFIKNRRLEKNLFQKNIAKTLGIDKNHYWMIENGLIKIKEGFLIKLSKILDFEMEDFFHNYSLNKFFDFRFPSEPSVKLFELLGYVMGDGCFTIINRGQCLLLTDKNRGILEYYQKTAKGLFNCESNLRKETSKNSYRLTLPSCVAQFFRLNFPEAILKTKELKIPRLVFNSSLDEIAGFLRGFFDAEASVDHHGVKACSSNQILLYQVDSLLKKFGIFSSIYLNQFEKIKKKYRHNLILYGENLRRFYRRVSFNHSFKKSKLKNYIRNLKVLRKSKLRRKGDFVLSEIKSVEDIKSNTKYLYDLAIPQYKNYIANQLIVHNSFWPFRLGREATIFRRCDSYLELIRQIKENDFVATIETDPAYGKYHWDGHRVCNFSCSPEKTRELNGICPKCNRPLIIGVENRVEELASEESEHKIKKIFYKLLPLHEIISLWLGTGMQSKKAWDVYHGLIKLFENEFNILLNVPREKFVEAEIDGKLIALILKNRKGNIKVKPGYDGEYGVAKISEENEQKTLF